MSIVPQPDPSPTILDYFRSFTWNKALTMVSVIASVLAVVVPYVDASWFRTLLIIFIAVSLKLQNLGNQQEIARTRTMIKELHDQNTV